MKKTLKEYGVAFLMIPQYVVTRTLYLCGWSLIAVANLVNGDIEQVKRLKVSNKDRE